VAYPMNTSFLTIPFLYVCT